MSQLVLTSVIEVTAVGRAGLDGEQSGLNDALKACVRVNNGYGWKYIN